MQYSSSNCDSWNHLWKICCLRLSHAQVKFVATVFGPHEPMGHIHCNNTYSHRALACCQSSAQDLAFPPAIAGTHHLSGRAFVFHKGLREPIAAPMHIHTLSGPPALWIGLTAGPHLKHLWSLHICIARQCQHFGTVHNTAKDPVSTPLPRPH